jgi:phage portal protein BeeE
MNAVREAMTHCRSIRNLAYDLTVKAKAKGGGFAGFDSGGGFGGGFGQAGGNRQQYALMRGWVYSAVHALATQAAMQSVSVGELSQKAKGHGKDKPKKPAGKKLILPSSLQYKIAKKELESDPDHELVPVLERPNGMQHRFQFVYSFVANMCLTGWSYIAVGKGDKEHPVQFYSVPTTWVTPVHDKGAFAQFKISNPNNPAGQDAKPLDRSQVAFAHFPNPADPLAALAPTAAQAFGIRIDDKIQASQALFFDNGMFPSCVITVGGNPHPDFPAGVRPRLNAHQRREIFSAIENAQAGVANYGRPAIVDGLIERIDRLQMNSQEMGWEKSDKSNRTRILSAFGVHPIILGEEVAGSYAQAYIVQNLFCSRVNVFLDMLSTLMSELCSQVYGDEDLMVWWEAAKANDPQMELQKWSTARQNDDVNQNEFREMMGLSPDEDGEPATISQRQVAAVTAVATQVSAGGLTPEQGQAILEGIGLPADVAKSIAGEGKQVDPMQEAMQQLQLQQMQQGGGKPPAPGAPVAKPPKVPPAPGAKPPLKPPKPTDAGAVQEAAKALSKAVDCLRDTPETIAARVLVGL